MSGRSLVVVVSRQDIDGARAAPLSSGVRCPITYKLERLFGCTALVNYHTLWRIDGSRLLTARAQIGRDVWKLPEEAARFMQRADQGCRCRPFKFTMEESDE